MSEYYIRQDFGSLRWQVVSLGWEQAARVRERGEVVYMSARQAHAVATKMNAQRLEGEAHP